MGGVRVVCCGLNWREAAGYVWWLFLTFRGYVGVVYGPAWVGLARWAGNDVAGYVGSLPELGGVAHTAHLGGEVAGLLTGVTLVLLRRY